MKAQQFTSFFANLTSRIGTARRQVQELDLRLAHRFNVFDYLRTDELGLSKIIADLLDPTGSHGQQTLFLTEFLRALSDIPALQRLLPVNGSLISVQIEAEITDLQRIDVLVRFDQPRESYVLAIENKPFADDGENQIRNYLSYLDERLGSNYLLVYLSPKGSPPTDYSITLEELNRKWTDKFRILSYYEPTERTLLDQFDHFRISNFSLYDWLLVSRQECEVDRLRWFLGDLAAFCQRRFGAPNHADSS